MEKWLCFRRPLPVLFSAVSSCITTYKKTPPPVPPRTSTCSSKPYISITAQSSTESAQVPQIQASSFQVVCGYMDVADLWRLYLFIWEQHSLFTHDTFFLTLVLLSYLGTSLALVSGHASNIRQKEAFQIKLFSIYYRLNPYVKIYWNRSVGPKVRETFHCEKQWEGEDQTMISSSTEPDSWFFCRKLQSFGCGKV